MLLLLLQKWTHYFETCNQNCVAINAHSKSSVKKLLEVVEFKLKEVICKEPTLLVMVVGVPNVGKSALINSIHQIAKSRFPGKSFANFAKTIDLNELKRFFFFGIEVVLFDSAGEDEARCCGSATWCYSRHCWIQGLVVLFQPFVFFFFCVRSLRYTHIRSPCSFETCNWLEP